MLRCVRAAQAGRATHAASIAMSLAAASLAFGGSGNRRRVVGEILAKPRHDGQKVDVHLVARAYGITFEDGIGDAIMLDEGGLPGLATDQMLKCLSKR
jgi:hypothetical protein